MTRMVIVLLLGLLPLAAAPARAEGALAVTENGFANGLSANRPDAGDARRVAMERCTRGGRACHIATTFSHTCIAYARDTAAHGPTDHWGYATRVTMHDANMAAVEACAKNHGADCKPIESACDR